MRSLLLALPFSLMPLSVAQTADHDHGSLDKHEHGAASLNVAVEGTTLEIALESPSINIVGFEHAARGPEDLAALASARAALEQPLALFAVPAAAECVASQARVQSLLFGKDGPDSTAAAHSDIDATYVLACSNPEALDSLSLAPFFKRFPGVTKVAVQLIGPNGQRGSQLSPASASISF